MATRLERSYALPAGKTVSGMAKAVQDYFEKYQGMDIYADQMNSTCYRITCRTKAATRTVKGNLKRLTGHDLDITVGLYQQGSQVKVSFDQEINEKTRTLAALITAPAGIGIVQLHGIMERHNIPFELDETITKYLK